MQMQLLFKRITSIIITCLVLSLVLHVGLYTSDSDAYRQWVTIQIVLQTAAIIALVYVRKFNFVSLIVFIILAIPFTYINAIYTNYGHLIQHLILVPIFWVGFLGMIFSVRKCFIENKLETGSNAA